MLNKNGERELAYVVKVNKITPMNADRLECAHIDGWHCVVGKGEFKEGDLAVYFEIDSKLPEVEPFTSMEFLKSKNYKVKTQKIRGEYSQGLLVPLDMLGIEAYEGEFLTEKLGVTYAVSEDNSRKASSADKYKRMAQRHPNIFKRSIARWLMRREWGKKLMFLFFGRKKDKKGGWPQWVKKTDEERVQNMPWLFPDNPEKWIATEKIDGTSTTFTMRGHGHKRKFFVCSRNVCFDKPNKKCFYETNVYTEMAEKYEIEKKLSLIMEAEKNSVDFITIQGETYGQGIQNRNYGLSEHKLAVFNFIVGYKNGKVARFNPIDCEKVCKNLDLPSVPVLFKDYTLPKTCEELLEVADGRSEIDDGMREGLVFRTYDGVQSFKAVSNKYLVKYHG